MQAARRRLAVMALLVGAGVASGGARHTQPSAPIAITSVTVVDVSATTADAALQRNQTVIVRDGLISAVGSSGRVVVPGEAQRIDGTGKYLMPGLWDMHTHLLEEDRLDHQPALYVANGVTGVRVLGSRLDSARIRQIGAAFARGTSVGPRLGAVTGRILENAAGRGGPMFLPIATAEEARRAVAAQQAAGADFVKVYNRLTRDMYSAVLDEAARRRVPVAGHIPMSMTAAEASDMGQRSFEHSASAGSSPAELFMSCSSQEDALREGWRRAVGSVTAQTPRAFYEELYRRVEERASATYDERKCAALFGRFVRNDTWQVPTLVVDAPATREESINAADPRLQYVRASVRQAWVAGHGQRMQEGGVTGWKARVHRRHQLVREMHAHGVRLLAGTDGMQPYVIPGFSLHDELALLVAAGLPPLAALQSATLGPAQFLGRTASQGTVQIGRTADLVLLHDNPLQHIRHTQAIAAVIAHGRLHDRASLDAMLTTAASTAAK